MACGLARGVETHADMVPLGWLGGSPYTVYNLHATRFARRDALPHLIHFCPPVTTLAPSLTATGLQLHVPERV